MNIRIDPTNDVPIRRQLTEQVIINMTIRRARATGYTLQALRRRVRERLLAEAPDHILVVEQDHGLRELMGEELSVIFCDSIAKRRIRSAKAIHYRLLAPESIDYVETAMNSYQEVE